GTGEDVHGQEPERPGIGRARLRTSLGQNAKNRVSHTVLALPRLSPRAYASSGFRQGFC
ncbi:MAG: DNA/RNA-binding winged helix domain-containing protein, partial [Elusimicrobiales bacterium]